MAKWIRTDMDIYIAPDIKGMYRNGVYSAHDESTGDLLDPRNIDDKIVIYERQVKDWFFNRAEDLRGRAKFSFIIFMISLSYIEGVQQYREGRPSNGRSKPTFRRCFKRIFGQFTNDEIDRLYSEARCGIFHNGMVSGQIILSDDYPDAIQFTNHNTIKINQLLFLNCLIADFEDYITNLQNAANGGLRENFNRMFINY